MAAEMDVSAQALHVVAREVAATLNDVRAALESSLENPGDPAPLQDVGNLLRQVRGVLRVVEVFGGALLAEEMEQTAAFLARSPDPRHQADGLDALMRATVQLPAYLERVLGGGRDLALMLLPLLNDLRTVRHASLLSEGTLLSLNLTSEQPPRPREPGSGAGQLTAAQLARRLRPRFQVALLGLIRGERSEDQLAVLADAAEQLEAAATTGPLFQFWWVVGAALEGLRAGGIEPSVSIKRLLGQADRELRRLYEQGEETYSASPPVDLINNLLFYIARSTTDEPRIAAVRTSFRLSELLPPDDVIEQEQESLSGPSVKLMHTVAAAIKEDLGRVKDALDLFTRKGGQPEELAPQAELLKKIGDTLAVLGLGSLRERVQSELARLSAMAARSLPADRESMIGMAAALISVEDSLDDGLLNLIMPPGAPLAGVIQDPEFRQVAEAVLRECGINLARIKELVSQALEPGGEVMGIDAVPQLARGVTAGLLMLGKTRAMDVMERSAVHVVALLQPGTDRPPQWIIDRLADAVVGIEYYMETLQAGRPDPWYMLDNAERCLAAIETPAEATPWPEQPVGEGTMPMLEAPAAAASRAEAAPELPAFDETVPSAADTLVLAPVPVPVPAAASVPAPAEPVDEELIEVFIEEAREEIGAIRRSFPLWADNASDQESLVRVRRAFHTLKGSGRMVGAMVLGDFAWSVESLLNRVIDGTRERTPDMMAALREAVAALPALVDATEHREAPAPGVDELSSRMRALAAGELPPAPVEKPAPQPAYEPTVMVSTLDEATMARMLMGVPAIDARPPRTEAAAEPPVEAPEAVTEEAPEAVPGEAPGAAPEQAPAVSTAIATGEIEPPAEAVEPAPEPAAPLEPDWVAAAEEPAAAQDVAAEEPEFPAELPAQEEAAAIEAYAAMDPSLQDIFRKEVQVHLDVFRDYLRRSWVTPGPHYVAEDLYRACHTLRGAARTAESKECIDLADPLHRWLRRLFDSDRPFDNDGLATLADAVAVFEDVVENALDPSRFLPQLEEVINRVARRDIELEQTIAMLAAEPREEAPAEAPAEPEPAEAEEGPIEEPPFEIDHLIPGISVDSAARAASPGAGFDRLLPSGEGEESVTGAVPYLVEPPAAEEPLAEAPEAPLSLPSVIAEVLRAEAAAAEAAAAEAAAAETVAAETGAGEVPAAEAAAEPEAPAEEAPPVTGTALLPDAVDAVEAPPPEPSTPATLVDYDADIAAIFAEEATELLEAADSALGAIRAERGSRERVTELHRALHTIKGGARMAGIRAMGDLSHELESLLMQLDGGSVPLDERCLEVMQAALDELNRMRDFVNAGRAVAPARDLTTRIRLIARGSVPALEPEAPPPEATATLPAEAGPEPLAETPPRAEPVPEPAPEPAYEPATGAAEDAGTTPGAEEGPEAPLAAAASAVLPGREGAGDRVEMARVDAELLDAMLNNAGEVSIYRARLEQQLSSIDFNLAELGRVVQRLKEQLRKLEIETEAQILHRHVEQEPRRSDFDPLELDRYSSIQQYSRALAETASDVASVQGLLGNLTREAQNLLTQQGRIVSDLQGGLMRTRMVPFQRHVQRLTRIVRQAAAEAGKRAELVIDGAAGEIDRQVLDRMLPPLEHLVRNAVVHGVETPAERAARGKPETGRITLALKREGSEVLMTIEDDGAGINLRAVRDKAAALGLLPESQELSDEQAKMLILEPGFTTAGQVTQSAGRGVGMDVVATEVKKLGGALFIDSEEGRGTRFTVRLPFTLAISQALVVRAGDEYFALPLPTIEGVVRVPSTEVLRQLAGEADGFEYGGQQYRFQHLSGFVGNEPVPPTEHDPAVPVILVRAGEHSTGIVTDELVGSREIVVKPVGPQIAGIRGISGATILGDGRICVILDVGALVRSEWRLAVPPERLQRPRADERVFALVVDDSITVRRVTQRLLERNGMRVMTAKDGLDAVAVLQDHVPDVILLDIEMPRMDGYEVASHVRNDPRLKHIPIVMITSRVGEKHRARAIELGVNDYLGKPYQETALLQALEPLVKGRRPR